MKLRNILMKYTEWLIKKGYINSSTPSVDYELAEAYLDSKASKSVREANEQLDKFVTQLDGLEKVHGKIVKVYDVHSSCNGYKFEDGAAYRISLIRSAGEAVLD